MSRLLAACSTIAEVQPTVRLHANVGVNMSRESPTVFITTPE